MAANAGRREAMQVAIGNFDRVGDIVGERAEARTENHADQRLQAAGALADQFHIALDIAHARFSGPNDRGRR